MMHEKLLTKLIVGSSLFLLSIILISFTGANNESNYSDNATLYSIQCPECPVCPICDVCVNSSINCTEALVKYKGYVMEPLWLLLARWGIVLAMGMFIIYLLARSNYWI